MKILKKLLIPIFFVAVVWLDQYTKAIIVNTMKLGEEKPFIGDLVKLKYIQNDGIAFGGFSGNTTFTLVLTCILLFVCLILMISFMQKDIVFLPLCLCGILAGGVSNFIDRFRLGYVVDMISCGNFPVFNIADMFVTCGCILCIIYLIFFNKKDI